MAALSFDAREVKGLVSVVIPTYRGERFIGEALESVGRQTYRNWEIVIVEDGSNGPTREIVKQFARRHRWHRVDYSRNETNNGPSPTRNAAFRRARGEFVAFLDADDRWFPDHLALSIKQLQSTRRDIVYSTAVMIEDHSDILLGVWGPQPHELADFPHGLFQRNFITPSATVLRRKVLADVGPWDTQLRYCEDLDFWLRCVAAGKTFEYLGGCHCLYRRNHQEAATNNMCAVQDAFAHVVERYMQLPGLRERTCRKRTVQAFVLAAQYHANANPDYDTSADPFRAARLMLHAWRLRPKYVKHLLRGMKLRVADLFRRRKPRAVPAPGCILSPPVEAPTQAAA